MLARGSRCATETTNLRDCPVHPSSTVLLIVIVVDVRIGLTVNTRTKQFTPGPSIVSPGNDHLWLDPEQAAQHCTSHDCCLAFVECQQPELSMDFKYLPMRRTVETLDSFLRTPTLKPGVEVWRIPKTSYQDETLCSMSALNRFERYLLTSTWQPFALTSLT